MVIRRNNEVGYLAKTERQKIVDKAGGREYNKIIKETFERE